VIRSQVVRCLCFVSLLIGVSSGSWAATIYTFTTIDVPGALWTYICAATYLVKLIPLYGGYAKGRTTLKKTMEWYLTDHHQLTNMLSTISLAPPVTIYLQTSVVIGLVVVIALRSAHLLTK
jgi:hypothetical protein